MILNTLKNIIDKTLGMIVGAVMGIAVGITLLCMYDNEIVVVSFS